MTIAVIGTGFVGVVSAAVFASHGHRVLGLDVDQKKVSLLQSGTVPFYEPGLEQLLSSGLKSGNLQFSTDYKSVIPEADVILITVGTPSSTEGKADLSYVIASCRAMAPHLKDEVVVVVKSTVPPGSFKEVASALSQATNVTYHLASVPEFLREGSAVADTTSPDRIVLGVTDQLSESVLTELHKPFQAPIIVTTPESAQLGKYAANSYLALRIGFINQIADFCEKTGANIMDVITIIGHDRRIGDHYWYPGLGYGGSCFPKDVRELAYTSTSLGLGETLFTTLTRINSERMLDKLHAWERQVGGFSAKKVAVLGLSFKPNTTDMREAPALVVIPQLLERGAQVVAYDPMAVEEAEKILSPHQNLTLTSRIEEALDNADIIIALVEWPQIITAKYQPLVTKKQWIIDARNQLDSKSLTKAGFQYIGIGVPELGKVDV